jgi:hypothetical protein
MFKSYRKYDSVTVDEDFIEDVRDYEKFEFVDKDIVEGIINNIESDVKDILDLFKDYDFKQVKEKLEDLAERLY